MSRSTLPEEAMKSLGDTFPVSVPSSQGEDPNRLLAYLWSPDKLRICLSCDCGVCYDLSMKFPFHGQGTEKRQNISVPVLMWSPLGATIIYLHTSHSGETVHRYPHTHRAHTPWGPQLCPVVMMANAEELGKRGREGRRRSWWKSRGNSVKVTSPPGTSASSLAG